MGRGDGTAAPKGTAMRPTGEADGWVEAHVEVWGEEIVGAKEVWGGREHCVMQKRRGAEVGGCGAGSTEEKMRAEEAQGGVEWGCSCQEGVGEVTVACAVLESVSALCVEPEAEAQASTVPPVSPSPLDTHSPSTLCLWFRQCPGSAPALSACALWPAPVTACTCPSRPR